MAGDLLLKPQQPAFIPRLDKFMDEGRGGDKADRRSEVWTDTTRALHARKGMALPGDMTDGELAVLEPLLPSALPFGRPWKWPLRRLVDAMFYLLRHGLLWRMLPQDFPPMTTLERYFHAWRDSGRRAGVIDSQRSYS